MGDDAVEPQDSGMLDVGDGNLVYWEVVGNPSGIPAVMVHGGPGSGCSTRMRRALDLDRFRFVLFDQRQCGRSEPHASDPRTDLSVNTTQHLVADMERLREHLRIDRWMLYGGSWGSTLALAYAERHPGRVLGIVLVAVTTTRRYEIDWLYRGVGRFFPQQWREFRDFLPAADRDGDLVAAYARQMSDPDPEVRWAAAQSWARWEDAVLSLEPSQKNLYSDRPRRDLEAMVRICAHYFANGAWLAEGEILDNAHRLRGIPGALVHGRLDMSGPLDTAWELAQRWPEAALTVVDDAGHKGSDAMRAAIAAGVDRVVAAAR
jgi:proline iminopeptidase